MFTPACSLHPMDVRLLKIFVAAIQGEAVPDLREEAARRRQRDILLNWSQRVVRAATFLAVDVAPEDWRLYTQLRPFFVTVTAPEAMTGRMHDLFKAHSLSEIVDHYREEVARLDADQADFVIDTVRHDQMPEAVTVRSADVIEENMRAYLIAERHELEEFFATSDPGALQMEKVGQWLSWRACLFSANIHPWWVTRGTSLTGLAGRKEYDFLSVMADPRGMFAGIVSRVPALQDHLPYVLTTTHSTGMCVPPHSTEEAFTISGGWPAEILSTGTTTPGEVRSLREALHYAQVNTFGLWEASEMAVPLEGILPIIEPNQAGTETYNPALSTTPAAVHTEETQSFAPVHYDEAGTTENEAGLDEMPAEAPVDDSKVPFWKKMLKKKS